ncbi:metabotropic glutamate receptor 4 [Trichonephila clavata]|uniref:Metabotropic glutamate receptor 4 n=1 Tax=Trichonephila clavata TaxID=2740835 RepID=A0A8X6IR24_TRICU|nr:metabotropic glutamate receptor 4 [Trichonephila clavata]
MAANVKLYLLLLSIIISYSITCCAEEADKKTIPNDAQERPQKSEASKKMKDAAKSPLGSRYEIKSKEVFQAMINSYKKRKNVTFRHVQPQRKAVEIDGDIILGGLISIHEKHENLFCGPLMPNGSVQALEAILFTLDKVNAEKDFLPGIKLGAYIMDDCNRDSYSLEQAVNFIQGSSNIFDKSVRRCTEGTPKSKVSGVISSTSSSATMEVAKLFRLFKIPQVSVSYTDAELSDQQKSEYLLGTVPSHVSQIDAILKLILPLNLSQVSVVYEDSDYGNKSFMALEKALSTNNISVGVNLKLIKNSKVTYNAYYDNVVKRLVVQSRPKGIVMFGSNKAIAGVMKAVHRNSRAAHFLWVTSNRFSEHGLISDINYKHMETVFFLKQITQPVDGFEDYFKSLNVKTNKRNPWFTEFWEQTFSCKLPDTRLTPMNMFAKNKCNGSEELSEVKGFKIEEEAQYVSNAVLAFAYAIKAMHEDLCDGLPGACGMMKPVNGTLLLKYLKNVSFKGLSGNDFQFNEEGNGPARFEILQIKQEAPGMYKWFSVDYHKGVTLDILSEEFCFTNNGHTEPDPVCNPTCTTGQVKKYEDDIKCCWQCKNCQQYQIVANETTCTDCPYGYFANGNYTSCELNPRQYLDISLLLIKLAFSVIGTAAAIVVFVVIMREKEANEETKKRMKCWVIHGSFLCGLGTLEKGILPVVFIKNMKIQEKPTSEEDKGPDSV